MFGSQPAGAIVSLVARRFRRRAVLELENLAPIRQRQIVKQAESRKMAVVRAEGLQPQQYNQVLQLGRLDKTFEQKFLSYVNEVKSSSS